MQPNEWLSEDGRFAVRASQSVVNTILGECRASGSEETGGILVGHYTRDHGCAVITGASAVPADSQSGGSWFYRGVQGLREWLQRLWWGPTREYYLGEWHFHPNGSTTMSTRDRQQIKWNARCASYRCPEPLLLIVADGANDASSIGLYVCSREGAVVCLHAVQAELRQ